MSRRVVKGRKDDRRKEREEQAAIQAAQQEALRQARQPALPTAPEVQGDAPAPKLGEDDLMAIAAMDSDELASLMEQSLRGDVHQAGDRVTGTVTRVGRTDIFVDVGGKSEGHVDRDELPDAKVGDTVELFVIAAGDFGVRLSKRLTGVAADDIIEEAKESGTPLEGLVTARNSGGYEVRLGDVRAFCPFSHMSRGPLPDPDGVIGQTLNFKVIETGDKLVVSRRQILEEEAEAFAEAFWGRVQAGDTYQGTVRNIQPYGAFIDLGGVDGLLPRSEITWGGNQDPSQLLSVGQKIEVYVTEINLEAHKLTLSAKDPGEDPWNAVGTSFHPGNTYPGVVVRVADFGAFVQLQPGLDGLVHRSKFAGKSFSVGDEIKVRLMSVDSGRRRLELTPVAEGAEGESAAVNEMVKGSVADVLRNGVVVQLDDGRTGWLSAREVELPAGTLLHQRFRRGKTIEARVLRVDGDRGRIELSLKSAQQDDSWRAHVTRDKKTTGGFGTLADLLGGLDIKK